MKIPLIRLVIRPIPVPCLTFELISANRPPCVRWFRIRYFAHLLVVTCCNLKHYSFRRSFIHDIQFLFQIDPTQHAVLHHRRYIRVLLSSSFLNVTAVSNSSILLSQPGNSLSSGKDKWCIWWRIPTWTESLKYSSGAIKSYLSQL